MRIGIDIRDLSTPIVGVGKATIGIIEYIQDNDDSNEYIFYEFNRKIQFHKKNITEKIAPIPTYAYFKEQYYFGAHSILDELDILHFPIHLPPFFKSKKTKIIFTVHDIHSETDSSFFPSDMNKYFFKKRTKAIQNSDLVIVHTNYVKKEIIKRFKVNSKNIIVIPRDVSIDYMEGVDANKIKRIRSKYSLGERFILYVGSIEPWKQVPLLIEEYNTYTKKYKDDIELVIIGKEGWRKDDCEKVAQFTEKNKKIKWLNYVSQDDLPVIYNAATVFSTASLHEGFGLILIEAMAANIPIVASNRGSIPEVVGDAGVLFDPFSRGEYAEKLNFVLSSSEKYNELVENAKRRFKEFESGNYGKNVFELYQKIC